MLGFLLAASTMPGMKKLRETKVCPAPGCLFVGPSRALMVHWRSFHKETILLYLCPLPGCSWQTPKPQGLRQHWENQHHAYQQQSVELRTLPLLAEFVRNRHRKDPGTCCPPVPPLQRPLGSLPHSSKGSMLVQVEWILSGSRASPPAVVMPPCPLGPQQDKPALPTGDQTVVVKETPLLAAVRKPAATVPDPTPDSPIVIRESPVSSPAATVVASPAFTSLPTPTLSVLLSLSPSFHGSPAFPPVTSPGPDHDPVVGGLSPVVQEPPRPHRHLLDKFMPLTPSKSLPRSTGIPICPATACAATGVLPSGDRAKLVERLQSIDCQRTNLEVERVDVLRHLASMEGEELQQLRQQLVEAQQHCRLLEGQLSRLRTSSGGQAQVMGDLQSLCTSHALLLMPERGHTDVFHLTQQDLMTLNMRERELALSCERL